MSKKVAVIGGGASGFFTALLIKESQPGFQVDIYEKTSKLLSKVKISGGGRCNVTHACFNPRELVKSYPRGEQELKSVFSKFQPGDVIAWFLENGVELKTEEDGRMFPVTDSSQTIIDCFLNKAKQLGINIYTRKELQSFQKEDHFKLVFQDESIESDYLVLATGGGNKPKHYDLLSDHKINGPLPSLFTFNILEKKLHDLKGLSVQDVEVKIEGSKLKDVGPLLITHWGMSGPAVIRLSAFGAEYLAELDYNFTILVNWIGMNQDQCKEELMSIKNSGSKAKIFNELPGVLPMRIRKFLTERAGISDKSWSDISKKGMNKLTQELTNGRYKVEGRTTFKEEFVICGGVDRKEVDFKTMESKSIDNLFIVGELLDVDGVTGGFNFQNAWSTSFIASKAITS